MGLLDGLKRTLALRKLPNAINNDRPRYVRNYGNANSVGIIYREKGEGFFVLVKQYVKYLRAECGIRDVMAIAYVEDSKTIPYYHKHKLRYDFFTSADLNFSLEPTSDAVKNFTSQSFDILLDFESEMCIPLRYVLAQSRAAMKVGIQQPDATEFYDVMIARPKDSTFDDYLKQLNHYLTLINTHHARA